MERKIPSLTVDIIIQRKDGSIILIKRKKAPFAEHWALPGGFIEYGETAEHAAIRETKEETGLDVEVIKLVGVYSDPKRDPRGHVIAIAFLAREIRGNLVANDDAKAVKVFKITEIPKKLAFDHAKIIKDALGSF
ncbi:MAG: NUDIX domain-containing protein [Promethearchaeota archaeon]